MQKQKNKNKGKNNNNDNKPSQVQPKQGSQINNNSSPQALADLQQEMMSKISAMKEGLMAGGEGNEVIEGLFKSLLGDFGGNQAEINKQEYIDSEPEFLDRMAHIDSTLQSKKM